MMINSELLRQISIFWSLFHILILFIMLYRPRFSQKKTVLLTIAGMLPLIILNVSGMAILGADQMGRILIFTCTIPSLIFFYWISKDKKWRFLFTFCLADTAAYWLLCVTNMLDFYLGGGKCVIMLISRLLLFPVIEWLAFRHLRKPYIELQDSVSKGWGLFALMSAFYYVLLNLVMNQPTVITSRPEAVPAAVMILILMPLTYATIFASLYRQLLLHRKQQEELIWKEQNIQLEARLENQQNIRKLKHDMKAHSITLSGLISSGKIEEAQEYMQNMVNDYERETRQQQFCINPYLNAIFSHYSQKFERAGVKQKLSIQIGEENLPFMELCQIISNGLENAWNAVEQLPQEQREVSVQLRYNREFLMIRVKNRCSAELCVEKGKLPPSTKGGAEHGFGLYTIQEAAKRLGGEMVCYTQEGYFLLDVMIKADRKDVQGRI